jgi:hypothetical protein
VQAFKILTNTPIHCIFSAQKEFNYKNIKAGIVVPAFKNRLKKV